MIFTRTPRGEHRKKKTFLLLPLYFGKFVYWFQRVELEEVWNGNYWETISVNGYMGGDYW